MELRSGTWTVGPGDGTLVILTKREGAAARMGHDLTLTATRWSATVAIDALASDASSVRATVDSGSLVVTSASGGALGLTSSQKAEVEAIIREKVLHSADFPRIAFASTGVRGDAHAATVTGDLTIGRQTRSVTLNVRAGDQPNTTTLSATTSIAQTDFGIKPYSTMLGTLRVTNVVDLAVEVRLPQQ